MGIIEKVRDTFAVISGGIDSLIDAKMAEAIKAKAWEQVWARAMEDVSLIGDKLTDQYRDRKSVV